MISLHKLEIFVTVCRAGSFSGAARLLYMSQPAVSQHIRDIESHLGTSLFVRSGARGAVPTAAGETLLEYASEMLRMMAEVESRLTVVENLEGGRVCVGATPGVALYLFPAWLPGFRASYPRLQVDIKTGTTAHVAEAVAEENHAYGFIEGELDELEDAHLVALRLEAIDLKLVVGREHHWSRRGFITSDELNGEAFVTRHSGSRTRDWLDGVFHTHHISPHNIAAFDNPEAIKNAVIANMGCAILPEYAVHHNLANGSLIEVFIEDVHLERYLNLLYNPEALFSPIGLALLDHLAATYPALHTLLQRVGYPIQAATHPRD